MRMKPRAWLAFVAVLVSLVAPVTVSHAEDPDTSSKTNDSLAYSGRGEVVARTTRNRVRSSSNDNTASSRAYSRSADSTSGSGSGGGGSASRYRYVPKEQYSKLKSAWEAEAKRVAAYNKRVVNAYGACLDNPQSLSCGRPNTLTGPNALDVRAAGDPADPNPAAPAPFGASLPPEVVAYTAVARLQLVAPEPMLGPPPEINEWKMAAVGYPLWLWADGNLDPAPVSDSVYELSVSLDARLQKVIFDMGDGGRVTCTTLTRKWTPAVTPGTPSPVCGYRYQKPSLPKGPYTVTARSFWAVDWSINGATGTLPFYQTATTTIPVGELQAIVR